MVDLTRYSVGTIVGRSFRKAGIFAPDELIPELDYINGIRVFGEMIDSWALDKLTVNAAHPRTLGLVTGKTSYTYGIGGDWSIPRPISVEADGYIDYGHRSVMTRVLDYSMSNWAYEQYWHRAQDYSRHPVVWVEDGFPMLRVHTGGSGRSLTLFVTEPITAESLGDIDPISDDVINDPYSDNVTASALQLNKNFAIQVPPGYVSTMIYNLTVELLAEYPIQRGQIESSVIINRAAELYESLKRGNWKPKRVADPRAPIPQRANFVAGLIVDPPSPDDPCKKLMWGLQSIQFNDRKLCWGDNVSSCSSMDFGDNKILFNGAEICHQQ
ncbi:MAG: hypothetical protein KAG66_02985 [Methylococcales bacterium]|nr:hypothetical protein [Methylococcales bacterium]